MSKVAILPVCDKTQEVLDGAINTFSLRIFSAVQMAKSKLGSPIEEILYAAMIAQSVHQIHWCLSDIATDWKPSFDGVFGFLQAKVGRYRVDFLIVDARTPSGHVYVVECDGYDFHERTPVQAKRDRRRDRWMTARNVRVLRFTGSEIFGDPEGCAFEIMSTVFQ